MELKVYVVCLKSYRLSHLGFDSQGTLDDLLSYFFFFFFIFLAIFGALEGVASDD